MRIFAPIFRTDTGMAIRFIAKFLISALVFCAPCYVLGQHDSHEEVQQENHEETQNNHEETTDDAHNDAHDREHGHGDSFSSHISEFIVHHIADANKIVFFGEGESEVSIPLPMIIYVENTGLDVFMSSSFHGDHGSHGPKHATGPKTGVKYTMGDVGISATNSNGDTVKIWDISITKSVFGMLAILTLLIVLLRRVAKSYSKREGMAPTGLTNFLEPLILFVRDDIAYPVIGKEKSQKFLPFLLTIFFFIVGCNLLGLIPFLGGFNITGTIGITLVLAFLVFIITTINSNKHYWGHILWPPGVPLPIKFILVPIEILSVFIKPTVLMIRLTANMSAGHIIILSFISLVFIFKDPQIAGIGMGVFSTLFMIFMYFLEILVAFLQAYVFTLLAAIYFSEATQEAHH